MPRRTKNYSVWINGRQYDGIWAVDGYAACEYVLTHILEELPQRNAEISAQEFSPYRVASESFELSEFELDN